MSVGSNKKMQTDTIVASQKQTEENKMDKKKKFRCYVKMEFESSTDIMATDKETARAEVEKIDFGQALKTVGGRKWFNYALHGGCTKVQEVVVVKHEIEK